LRCWNIFLVLSCWSVKITPNWEWWQARSQGDEIIITGYNRALTRVYGKAYNLVDSDWQPSKVTALWLSPKVKASPDYHPKLQPRQAVTTTTKKQLKINVELLVSLFNARLLINFLWCPATIIIIMAQPTCHSQSRVLDVHVIKRREHLKHINYDTQQITAHKNHIPARIINVKNCKPLWISILSMVLVNFIVIWLLVLWPVLKGGKRNLFRSLPLDWCLDRGTININV
jgi:hypothetical protein